jgi:hypothetical protein
MAWTLGPPAYFIIVMSINKIKLKQIDADFDALVGEYGSGRFTPLGSTPENVVFQSGDQNITGIKNFVDRPTLSGKKLITTNDAVLLTGDQDVNGLKNFYARPLYNSQPIATFDKTVNLTGAQFVSGQKTLEFKPIVGGEFLAKEDDVALLGGTNPNIFTSINTFYNSVNLESSASLNCNYATLNFTYAEFAFDTYSSDALASNLTSSLCDLSSNQFVGGQKTFTNCVTSALRPTTNANITLGNATFRWSQVYATNGTINTSDANFKTGISEIPDDWLEAWAQVDFFRFKFINSVEEKGGFDNARWHVGPIAQKIHEAFSNKGLNAFDIGILCLDETVESTPTGDVTGQIWSIRPSECHFMEMALNRKRLSQIWNHLSGTV